MEFVLIVRARNSVLITPLRPLRLLFMLLERIAEWALEGNEKEEGGIFGVAGLFIPGFQGPQGVPGEQPYHTGEHEDGAQHLQEGP